MDKQDDKKAHIINDLKKTRDYNQMSIDGMKKTLQYLPYLNEAIDVIDKNIEAMNIVPSIYFTDFPQETLELIEANKANASQYYGKVNQLATSANSIATTTTAAISGTMSIYNWLGDRDKKDDISTALEILKNAMSDKKVRTTKRAEIRQLLGKLLRPESNRYEDILIEIGKAKLDIQSLEGLAFSMRTLLEKIKGALKLKLTNQIGVRDNKILPAVAKEFIDPIKSSSTYITYMILIDQYNQFVLKLTNIGKLNINDSDGIDKLEIDFDNIIRSLLLPLKDIL